MSSWPPDAGPRLLAIARAAVEAAVERRPAPQAPDEPWLREPRAVFVTLRERGTHALRGCIGQVEARHPLADAVAEAARGASLEDPRFPPVAGGEVGGLELHVSVLTPPQPTAAEEIEIGRDGVVVSQHGRRALFLPEVATEQGWDRDTLLRHLCLKAGLPALAWREPGAELSRFETRSFEE